MKPKLTVMDVKQAIWNKDFRELFPEFKESLDRYLKDPGCACNLQVILSLMSYKDRMREYFPDREIVSPQEEAPPPNSWQVINCPIGQLEDKMRRIGPGKRMVAAARWRDRVTIVLNDVDASVYIPPSHASSIDEQAKAARESNMNWKVINTNIHQLVHELRKLQGPKGVILTRWQDSVTAIVNDRGTLF